MNDLTTIDVILEPAWSVIDVDGLSTAPVLIEVAAGGGMPGAPGPPGPPGADGSPGLAFIGQHPPPSPLVGALWWDSFDTLELYVWYDDGTSHQWVVANTAQGGGGSGASHPFTLDGGDY